MKYWNFEYDSIQLYYFAGVEYIHGELMYGHRHGLVAEVDQQSEEMDRYYEAHIFVGKTKHVSC